MSRCLPLGLILCLLPACDGGSRLCEPGASQSCSCGPASPIGTSECSPDGQGWEACECPAADGDGDADEDAPDGDVDGEDSGGDADADIEPFEPLASCTGAVTEERWLVAPLEGPPRAYLTDRGCADPELLCADCLPAAISPSGDAVLVIFPGATSWRPADGLGVVALDGAAPDLRHLDVQGARPSWIDDDSFLYVAATPDRPGPCTAPGPPEQSDLRRHVISTGEDHLVASDLHRAWAGGATVPSPGGDTLALSLDYTMHCSEADPGVALLDLDTGEETFLTWTDADPSWTVGLLPAGAGFLVQNADPDTLTSMVYAVSFDGRAQNLLRGLDVFSSTFFGDFELAWIPCGTARRLGPACELYCVDNSARLLRVPLDGSAPEPVECSIEGAAARLVDVWQR